MLFIFLYFRYYPSSYLSNEIIFISLPHSIIYFLMAKSINTIIIWQLVYYSIITYYCRLKIQITIENILKNDKIRNLKIQLNKLNDISLEINEYNRNYWSIFLGIYWILISLLISAFIYLAFFAKIIPIIRYIGFVFSVELFLTLVFITHFSSQLNKQFIKSYKILNSLSIQYNKSLHNKIKVIINLIIY